MKKNIEKNFYTIKELYENKLLGYGKTTTRKIIKSGLIESHDIAKPNARPKIIVYKKDLEKYLKDLSKLNEAMKGHFYIGKYR